MNGLIVAIVIIAALVSRPLEARLWRAGRLSDRTTALLMLGRFPILIFVFGLILGVPPLMNVVFTAGAVGLMALFYPFMRTVLRDAKANDH